MIEWLSLGGLVALVVFIAWRASRARELFCLSVRRGEVIVVRGRVLATTMEALRDVCAKPPVERATLRAVREGDRARLVIDGDVSEGQAQRMRNVFALEPLRRLLTAPGIKRPTLGQRLGWAWLAWRDRDRG